MLFKVLYVSRKSALLLTLTSVLFVESSFAQTTTPTDPGAYTQPTAPLQTPTMVPLPVGTPFSFPTPISVPTVPPITTIPPMPGSCHELVLTDLSVYMTANNVPTPDFYYWEYLYTQPCSLPDYFGYSFGSFDDPASNPSVPPPGYEVTSGSTGSLSAVASTFAVAPPPAPVIQDWKVTTTTDANGVTKVVMSFKYYDEKSMEFVNAKLTAPEWASIGAPTLTTPGALGLKVRIRSANYYYSEITTKKGNKRYIGYAVPNGVVPTDNHVVELFDVRNYGSTDPAKPVKPARIPFK